MDHLHWSTTTAMPGKSLCVPAGPGSCPFMDASTPDHVCSYCYARQGQMVMHRQIWVRNAELLGAATVTRDWRWLSEEIRLARSPHLRIFASGDFQFADPELLNNEVNNFWYPALRLLEGDGIKVWISSRAPNKYPELFVAITALPWVNIRTCSPIIDRYLPQPVTTTAVVLDKVDPPDGTFFCRKTYDGSCEDSECLACWDKNTQIIGYQKHGNRVQ